MDFRSYSKKNINNTINNQDNSSKIKSEKDIQNAINTYSKMSDAEMMQALFREVNKEKAKGIFDINNIRKFYRSIAPMLDNKEREKMRNIIDAIEDN